MTKGSIKNKNIRSNLKIKFETTPWKGRWRQIKRRKEKVRNKVQLTRSLSLVNFLRIERAFYSALALMRPRPIRRRACASSASLASLRLVLSHTLTLVLFSMQRKTLLTPPDEKINVRKQPWKSPVDLSIDLTLKHCCHLRKLFLYRSQSDIFHLIFIF